MVLRTIYLSASIRMGKLEKNNANSMKENVGVRKEEEEKEKVENS